MRSLLRRIAAGLLASIAVTGALVVSSVTPASADTYGAWGYLRNGATNYCLATDWSTNVYTWSGCSGPQRWRPITITGDTSGSVVLQNEATGRCLKQVDYFHVISEACNGLAAEFHWASVSSYLYSTNTLGFLVTDYSGAVYLDNEPTLPANQYWYWY